jgi:hypothetical protein
VSHIIIIAPIAVKSAKVGVASVWELLVCTSSFSDSPYLDIGVETIMYPQVAQRFTVLVQPRVTTAFGSPEIEPDPLHVDHENGTMCGLLPRKRTEISCATTSAVVFNLLPIYRGVVTQKQTVESGSRVLVNSRKILAK